MKYTNKVQVKKAGSWPIVGIAWYREIYRCILNEHKACATNDDDPCDKWNFDSRIEIEDSGEDASDLHLDATIMIVEVDIMQYNWGDDLQESESEDIRKITTLIM